MNANINGITTTSDMCSTTSNTNIDIGRRFIIINMSTSIAARLQAIANNIVLIKKFHGPGIRNFHINLQGREVNKEAMESICSCNFLMAKLQI